MPAKHCPKCGAFLSRTYVRKSRRFKKKGTAGGVMTYSVPKGYWCKKCGRKEMNK